MAAVLAALGFGAPAARADWNGDGPADVLAINGAGELLLYRSNGASGWITGRSEMIGTGWGGFTALLAPGDFSGDGKPDVLVRDGDGRLLMYRGNGSGGWATGHGQQIGTGWGGFTALLAPGDFNGDGHPDVLGRASDGRLLLYPGDGDGGWLNNAGEPVGSGWGPFPAVIAGGDFSGDGNVDVLAVGTDGRLLLYRGNGRGGWATGQPEPVGTGWGGFTALASGGDFSGDGKPDILARNAGGELLQYRGTGTSGFLTSHGEPIGTGWNGLNFITLAPATPVPAPAPPAPTPAPPAPVAPLPDGNVSLTAGLRCTPPGGRLRVSLRVRRRADRPAPRVRRVVFFVRNGPRRTDHRRPYVVRLRMNRPAGQRGRVYARVYFRRSGSTKLSTKTVSRRFVMCS